MVLIVPVSLPSTIASSADIIGFSVAVKAFVQCGPELSVPFYGSAKIDELHCDGTSNIGKDIVYSIAKT